MQRNYETQVNKFINILMKRGKKNVAKTILFDALILIKKKTSKNPLYILRKALHNSIPIVTFLPTRRGSKWYNIPTPIKDSRGIYLGVKWLLVGVNERSGATGKHNFAYKLCDELIDTANGVGNAVKQ